MVLNLCLTKVTLIEISNYVELNTNAAAANRRVIAWQWHCQA